MDGLGLSSQILRRDYLYGSLLAEGYASFEMSPAELMRRGTANPISGEQDYLVATSSAHKDVVRIDGQTITGTEDSAEVFDVVVIGAGLSGLAASYYVQQNTNGSARVLIIENHDDFGGNARRDEFQVGGRRLYAPQASTVIQDLSPALSPSDQALSLFSELGIDLAKKRVPEDQYWFGVFRDGDKICAPAWYANFLAVPMSDSTKASLGAFFETVMHFYDGDWQAKLKELDNVTFKDYVLQRGWTDEFFQLMVPQLAAFFGFPDAVSAACVYAHYGTKSPRYIYAFPGGNSGLARHLVKALIPNAFESNSSEDGVLSAPLRKDNLDRVENSTRLRLNCSAVRVEHDSSASQVLVTVRTDGRHLRLRARTAIMACGGFVTRRIVADLPKSHSDAFNRFIYSPVLWANVALHNSRALDKAGLSLLSSYSDGFGGVLLRYENIKPSSESPERPSVLGVACPRFYAGKDAREQERLARHELVSTPFQEYEKHIRQDLVRVLGPWGFDPAQDIAAIVLHRWAQHTYVFGYPGFFTSGVVETAKQPFGRIAFAHTDLHKFSLVMGAVEQGRRAAREVCERLGRQAGAAD